MPVIDFSAVGAKGSKAALAEGEWEAVVKEVNVGESKVKKTPYVEIVWRITDEEAVRTDGSKATKSQVWDQYYVSTAAFWRFQMLASALGVDLELPDSGEEEISAEDLAESFRECVGDTVNLTTEVEHYTQVKNGEEIEREKAVVAGVEA